MRYVACLCFIIFSLGQAEAQESDVTSACVLAIKTYYANENLKVGLVQDFSNLKPPRARVRIETALGGELFRCNFASNSKPLHIREFCTSLSCHKSGDERFDEIAEMLRRSGY